MPGSGLPILESTFLQLVQIAIGRRENLDRTPGDDDWKTVLALARKQSMVGVCCRGMMMLPAGERPNVEVKVKMGYLADAIRDKNRIQQEQIAQIVNEFAGLGLEGCLLKGQVMAARYPDPGMRNPGDIDLWVKGGCRHVLKLVKGRWQLDKVFYHHTGIHPFDDKTEVEVHFTPSWMNDLFANRMLQKYFTCHADAQFANSVPDLGCAATSVEFDCVYCAVHIYRHLLSEGVGMRQVLDYCFVLEHSTCEERAKAWNFMCSLGMKKFLGALMFVENRLFLTAPDKLLCKPDPVWGEFLLNEIVTAGNFGKYDPRFRYDAAAGLPVRAWMRMTRLCRYVGIAPREVIWAPVFKAWQYCWRLWIKISI